MRKIIRATTTSDYITITPNFVTGKTLNETTHYLSTGKPSLPRKIIRIIKK